MYQSRYLKTRLSKKDCTQQQWQWRHIRNFALAWRSRRSTLFIFLQRANLCVRAAVLMVFICLLLCRSSRDFVSLAVRCLNDLNYRLTRVDKKSNSARLRWNKFRNSVRTALARSHFISSSAHRADKLHPSRKR